MGRNKVRRIDDSTWSIEELNGMVYGFLLTGKDRAILIDTGFGTCDYKKIVSKLTVLPTDVINTHGHLDHVSQNWAFDRVYIHKDDIAVLKEHSTGKYRLAYLQMLLEEGKVPSKIARSGLVAGVLHKVCYIPTKDNTVFVADGDGIDLGGRTLQIIHTPGHTPGSICILDRERRQLFSGDTICDEGVLLHFDHSCSVTIFKQSCEKLKAMSRNWVNIWPAHHVKPIDNSFIDEYIALAEEIIAKEGVSIEKREMRMQKRGRIALSYTTDNI